jgi:hypothetical protein
VTLAGYLRHVNSLRYVCLEPYTTLRRILAAQVYVPFWKRLFQRVDTGPAVSTLYVDLGTILRSDPEIRLIEHP